MTDKERAAMAALIYESIRFSLCAAGEGLSPIAGENAMAPEDFIFAYAQAIDVDDWNGLDSFVRDTFLSLSQAERGEGNG